MKAPVVLECLDTVTVSRLAGVNPSTLDYWVRTRLVRPSVRPEPGKRRPRLWAVRDVILVRTITELRASGCPLQRVRAACRQLEERWDGLRADTVLVWNGADVLRLGRSGGLESLLQHPGQQVFRLVTLPIGHWHREALGAASYLREDLVEYGVPVPTRDLALKAVS